MPVAQDGEGMKNTRAAFRGRDSPTYRSGRPDAGVGRRGMGRRERAGQSAYLWR
jgi:hypothetical protein